MIYKILVILFMCAVMAKGCFGKAEEPFELDEFLNGTYTNRGFSGTWMSSNAFYYRDPSTRDILQFNVETWTSELLFSGSVLNDYPSASFTLSKDNNFVLIRYNSTSVFRHSIVSKFVVYDLTEEKYHTIADEEYVQYVQWSPVGNSIVYVYKNNIYYISSPGAQEVQITTDGVEGVVYNGIPDWVYEEEVLSSGSALWFSPDGASLAFGYFDDEHVPEFIYFMYDVEPVEYPEVVKLRYPKVNAINPNFELKVVVFNDPNNVKSLPILPNGQLSRDHVLFDVTWATNDEVVAVVENRVQNEAEVRRCKIPDATCELESSYAEPNGWLELEAPIYNSDGTQSLLLLSQPEGDDSYQHLVLYDVASKEITRLTEGKRVVTSISGWDKVRNLVYYFGTAIDAPSNLHLYHYNLSSNTDLCITCTYETPEGPCLYASATFSTDYSYFAEICQGPGPNYISINKADDLSWAKPYEENLQLREQLLAKLLPEKEDFEIPVDGGFTARARLLLPPGIDRTGSTQYPMIVNVYGGPDSSQISDRFSLGFQNYLVTKRQHIYAYIDGRGSGRKGDNMRYQIYRGMATVEIEDQIAVTKALRDICPYIDPNRIGIWGWSYGGFATAWVLVQDVENVFKLGLSVAPVTSFTLYDSIYTERYMGLATPDDNEAGYNNTDLMRRVEGLRNKSFFLIHGNADDNVHYQQSMLLAKALEEADIMFYQMSYPDENHSLSRVYPHLYHNIDRFFARCFGLPDPVYRHAVAKDYLGNDL